MYVCILVNFSLTCATFPILPSTVTQVSHKEPLLVPLLYTEYPATSQMLKLQSFLPFGKTQRAVVGLLHLCAVTLLPLAYQSVVRDRSLIRPCWYVYCRDVR